MSDNQYIYFDNAAAKLMQVEDCSFFTQKLFECGGNSESRHFLAFKSRQAQKNATKKVLEVLKLRDYDILYFGSGTEIFNFLSYAYGRSRTKNIVTTELEHVALLANLRSNNAEIRYIKIADNHQLDLVDLRNKIDKDTEFVALNHVQSETGLKQNLSEAVKIIRDIAPDAVIFSDTIQSIGKIDLPSNLDLYSISSHKIGGVGCAGLIFRNSIKLDLAKLHNEYRHHVYSMGRVETANILLMAEVLQKSIVNQIPNMAHVTALNSFIREKIKRDFGNEAKILFTLEESSPYILQILFPKFDGAVLAGFFSEANIAISSASACMAESKKPSQALKALQVPVNELFSSIRLSFSEQNSQKEAVIFLEKLRHILNNY